MISAENMQFPTDFSQKFNKYSSTIMLPWQQWMSHETKCVFKTKAYEFILKVKKFQLPTVYRFSTAEGTTWLWMDSAPPGLNRVKSHQVPASFS